MGFMDIFNVGKIKAENEKLKKWFNELGGQDVLDSVAVLEELANKKQKSQATLDQLSERVIAVQNDLRVKQNQVIALDDELLYESFALYKPHFALSNSTEYKERLAQIREEQKSMIKNGIAAQGNTNWTVNNSKSQGKKMVNDMIKLVLRSFNNECDYCVDNVKFNNIESHEKRINQSFDALNKLGQIMAVAISPKYKKLKFNELYLAFEYQQKKQQEKEEQRRIREELREQAKLEQEIRQAREKIAKERKHFKKAIEDMNAKILSTTNGNELAELQQKLIELESNMDTLNKEESLVDYREKNAKAGYVYIISNIGAFGENIFKIGMTRRLEPMERVDELGDASVPFSFDVHALIFSENAPELESKLHKHFYSNRINKLNNRKEFFRADIKEIEQVVKENYDKAIDVVYVPPASQYRESLLIRD